MDNFSLSDIDSLVNDRLVSRRPHPHLPLSIYNYTAKAQHLPIKGWSKELRMCRGLVLDENGEPFAKPFQKFWNYSQVLDQIPSSECFTVWEKMDGSLGILFAYKGQRIVATRGAFESEQALWAERWFTLYYPDFLPDDGLTYLFEIIYPENRIVVDYADMSGCFLLAVLDADWRDQDDAFGAAPFPKARRFDGITEFSDLDQNASLTGHEGLVVRWDSGFRAKLKLAEYVRLHRLITQCSNRTIWELLRDGRSTDELFESVPADFKTWARDQIDGLRNNYAQLDQTARSLFDHAPKDVSRKEFAEYAKRTPYPGLLFSLLDGRPINDMIWKMVEPEWQRPFKVVEE